MRRIALVADETGVRLDRYLAARIPNVSRTRIRGAIDRREVSVDGRVPKPSDLLSGGETIVVYLQDPLPVEIEGEPMEMAIIHEDDAFLAVNKPAGIVVHPGAGNARGTLVHGLVHHFGKLSELSGADRPGIVHRLDKDTSGILLVARTEEAHRRLARQFARRQVNKTYLAVVWGDVYPDEQRIDSPIRRHPRYRQKYAVDQTGRDAVTDVGVVERYGGLTFVRLSPRTGRTHQLRVHLASIGHPIFGDALYGGGKEAIDRLSPMERTRVRPVTTSIPRQMLHALSLSFLHPSTGLRAELTAPLPDDIQQVLHALRPEPD